MIDIVHITHKTFMSDFQKMTVSSNIWEFYKIMVDAIRLQESFS